MEAGSLRFHDDFAWFTGDARDLPREFTHVFCDGPAILPEQWPDRVYANWRVGVVPVLQHLGIRFREILRDDAEDARCPSLCERWNQLGIVTEVTSTPTGRFVLAKPQDGARSR